MSQTVTLELPDDVARKAQSLADAGRQRLEDALVEWIAQTGATELDHLVPVCRGGETAEDNLWLACSGCNECKRDRVAAPDGETGQVVPLFDPRRQLWADHFEWSDNGIRVIGLTATGRATVVALQLNRPILVSARRMWVAVGWHPPEE